MCVAQKGIAHLSALNLQIKWISGVPTRRVLPSNLKNFIEAEDRDRLESIHSGEERDGKDEESTETHVIASCSCNNDKDEINMVEDDEYVYLDNCASIYIFRD